MLMKEGDLIINQQGTPVALIIDCDNCIMINRAFWNDRGIRARISELAGGARKHLKMPHELFIQLIQKQERF